MFEDWPGLEVDTSSPYYPFPKVVDAATLAGAQELPYVLTRYLMDLPMGTYDPPAGNEYPRARLKKMLYWDGPQPLSQPLPTTAQMKSIQFDPQHPASPPDQERGYRIYSQELVQQAQTNAQTILRVYLGDTKRVQSGNIFFFRQYIHYTILTNYALESNMGSTAASRSYAMAEAIVEATEGVNVGGIGGLCTERLARIGDDRVNVGYRIYQYIDWNGREKE